MEAQIKLAHDKLKPAINARALSRLSLAPQLSNSGVGEPPHIPFTVLSQTRQAIRQSRAHLLRIIVRELGVGFDKRPRFLEGGVDQFGKLRVERHRHSFPPLIIVPFPISRRATAVQRAVRCCAAKICCSAERHLSLRQRYGAATEETSLGLLADPAPRPAPISPFRRKCRRRDDSKRGERARLLRVDISTKYGEHRQAGEQR